MLLRKNQPTGWGSLVFASILIIIFLIQALYHHYTINVLQEKITQQEILLKSLLSVHPSIIPTPLASNYTRSDDLVNHPDAFTPHSTYFLTTKSPPNRPAQPAAIPAEELEKVNKLRGIYGGKNDPAHLGGFIEIDQKTISENAMKFLLYSLNIRSVIDVGCGKGFSTNYFLQHGAKVLCVEGSHDAVTQSLLPKNMIIEHDFSLGPWWPEETFDAVWSTEFLEHVGRQYMPNYLPIFKKAAFIFVTSSGWGGWHHVEVHHPQWWASKLTALGFVHSPYLTQKIQDLGRLDHAQSIGGINVYINPSVSSLLKHHHLVGGYGCFDGDIDNTKGGIPCKGVDELPLNHQPLIDCVITRNKTFSCQPNPNREKIRKLA